MKMCSYGCGQEAKYQFKNGKCCCAKSSNSCPEQRKRNTLGLKLSYKTGKRKVIIPIQKEINGVRKCTISLRKNLQDKYDKLSFNEKPFSERKRVLLLEQNNKCAICGIDPFWNDSLLNFHYDHINGNRKDNSRKNSRLICPNCHSQTKTYCRGKKEIISEEKLKNELILTKCNINKSLKNLGVTTGGTNWRKAKLIIKKFNLPE